VSLLTEREVRIVRYLHNTTIVPVKALASAFFVSESTMSRTLSGISGGAGNGMLTEDDYKMIEDFVREHIDRRPDEDRRS
jgi:hypothetical protein